MVADTCMILLQGQLSSCDTLAYPSWIGVKKPCAAAGIQLSLQPCATGEFPRPIMNLYKNFCPRTGGASRDNNCQPPNSKTLVHTQLSSSLPKRKKEKDSVGTLLSILAGPQSLLLQNICSKFPYFFYLFLLDLLFLLLLLTR